MTPALRPAIDGRRFHDQGRYRSSEVTRALASATQAAAQGAQSETSDPDDVPLGPDVAVTDLHIVRGAD